MRREQQELERILQHIVEAIAAIESYVDGSTFEQFRLDQRTQDAVLFKIVVAGEASRDIERLFPEYAQAHPELPLAQAYRMRNRIAHGYATIDLVIVWRTATENLPALKLQLLQLHPSLIDR